MHATRRRTPVAVAAAVVVTTTLAACGSSKETARAAGLVPKNAVAFVSLNLAPSIAQKRNLEGIVSKFSYKGAKDDFTTQLDRGIAKAVQQGGLDFQRDVKPWLGNEVAFAVLPGARATVVALVKSKDDAKAKAALTRANATMKANDRIAFRIVSGYAVITGQQDAGALDTVAKVGGSRDSLAGQAKFSTMEENLHGDRLVLGWIDGKQGFDALRASGRAPVPLGADQVFGGANGFTAFDLHAGNDVAVLESVARAGTSPAKPGDPRLTRGLPANTFGAFTAFDLATGFQSGLKTLGALPGIGSIANIQQQFAQSTGLDLDKDLLSWMHGEAVVSAAPSSVHSPVPDFGLVVAPNDHAAAQAGLTKLTAAIQKSGLQTINQDIGGTNATVVAQKLPQGIQPAFALLSDRFVLASNPTYFAALAKTASPPFGDSDGFRHTIGAGSSTTNLQIVLGIAGIRDAVVQTLTGHDRAVYDRDIAKNVRPIEAAGLRAFRDGDLQRVEFKVSFK